MESSTIEMIQEIKIKNGSKKERMKEIRGVIRDKMGEAPNFDKPRGGKLRTRMLPNGKMEAKVVIGKREFDAILTRGGMDEIKAAISGKMYGGKWIRGGQYECDVRIQGKKNNRVRVEPILNEIKRTKLIEGENYWFNLEMGTGEIRKRGRWTTVDMPKARINRKVDTRVCLFDNHPSRSWKRLEIVKNMKNKGHEFAYAKVVEIKKRVVILDLVYTAKEIAKPNMAEDVGEALAFHVTRGTQRGAEMFRGKYYKDDDYGNREIGAPELEGEFVTEDGGLISIRDGRKPKQSI